MRRVHARFLASFVAFAAVGGTVVTAAAPAFAAPSCTTTCFVNAATGNDTNDGLTAGTALRTMNAAVAQVSPGGTVVAAAGTYDELVTVNKSITLSGAQAGVDARSPRGSESILTEGSGKTPLWVGASDVTVDGFTIEGNTNNNLVGAGVYLEPHTHGTQFVNNIVRDNIIGLYLVNDQSSDPTLVRHNLFEDNTNPGAASGTDIYADQFTAGGAVDGASIDANEFTNSGFVEDAWAVDMSNTALTQFSNLTVSNNTINNHGRGVEFFGTANSTVTQNTFAPGATNHYGVLLCGGTECGVDPSVTNTNITITFNALGCSSCIGKGAYVLDVAATGITINRNDLHGLPVGISSDATATVDGTCNWWGQPSGPALGQAVGSVTTSPFLGSSNLSGPCPAVTVPDAPTIGSATSSPSGVGTATVSFTPPLSDGGSPITGYTVTCVSLEGQPTVVALGTGSPITVSFLQGGTPYQCSVTATNAIGTGPASGLTNVVWPTPGAPSNCDGTMSAPTPLTTAPGNGYAVVSWGPSFPDPGCVAGYIVTPFLGTAAQQATLVPGHGTTTVIKGLTNGLTYTFTITPEDGHLLGPASAPTKPVTVGSPGVVAAVHVARVAKGALRITFTRPAANGAAITSYTARCKSTNGGATKVKNAKASPITVTGLTAGKAYACTVTATNSRGTGPASRASRATDA